MITRPTAPRGVSGFVYAAVCSRHQPIGLTAVIAIAAMLCLSPAAQGQLAVTIDSPSIVEGNPPDAFNLVFTITLSGPAAGTEKFDYTTVDGSAVAGTNYQTTSGSYTFAIGELQTTILVPIISNTTAEADMTFTLKLSNFTGGLSPPPPTGTGTIIDDDPRTLTVDIKDAMQFEGNSGTKSFVFKLKLNVEALGGESVDVWTEDGTATAVEDYVPILSTAPTVVPFVKNDKEKTVTVTVNGDTKIEYDETFLLKLANTAAAPVVLNLPNPAQAQGIIWNDEMAQGVTYNVNGDTLTVSALPTSSASEYYKITFVEFAVVTSGKIQWPQEDDPTTEDVNESLPAIPTEDTKIIQVLVNGAPLFIAGPGAPANITSQGQLDAIKAETIKNVIIHAGAGNDVVDALDCTTKSGVKTMQFGDAGNDILFAGSNGDYLDGGAGNDHLIGGSGDDKAPEDFPFAYITGGDGNDIVDGGGGNDIISGGSGQNVIIGGPGNDVFYSQGSYDVLDYSTSGSGVTVDLATGVTADDGFVPAGKDTTITNSGTFSVLRGSRFDDCLKGYDKTGTVILGGDGYNSGGNGSDIVSGGGFDDIIYGEAGNDTVSGLGGDDIIMGGSGSDLIYGGPGSDEIYGDGDEVPQNFSESTSGNDYVPDDQMITLTLHPLAQGATPAVPFGLVSSCTIVDTNGILNIGNCLKSAGVVPVGNAFRLPASEEYAGPGALPTLTQPGVAPGSDDDTKHRVVCGGPSETHGGLYGGGGNDYIAGGGGSDVIYGGSDTYTTDKPDGPVVGDRDSSDVIFGDYVVNRPSCSYHNWWGKLPLATDLTRAGGDDRIHAGFGSDMVVGGTGSDLINGNVDGDTIYGDFYFENSAAAYLSINAAPGASGWNDIIRGNEGTDRLYGGPGNDTLIGGDSNDGEYLGQILGESGDFLQGNSGNDYLIGCELLGLPLRIYADPRSPQNPDFIDRGFGWAFPSRSSVGVDNGPYDTIDYTMVPSIANGGTSVSVDLLTYTAQDGEGGTDTIFAVENVNGSANGNTLIGNDSDNVLTGGSGNDLIIGGIGNDTLYGLAGDDEIWGDRRSSNGQPPAGVDDPARIGSDYLVGGPGNDRLFGEWGNDIIDGGTGNNYLDGGSGTDILDYEHSGPVAINLSEANIDLTDWGVLAVTYGERVRVATDDKHLWPLNPVTGIIPVGGFPAATMTIPDDAACPYPWPNITIAFPGGNVLPGFNYDPANAAARRGLGTVFHDSNSYDVVVNRYTVSAPVIPDSVDNLSRFEIIIGSSASDIIYGHGAASTTIYGWYGNDILVGGAGNDYMYGGNGSDIIEGGLGNDLIVGSDTPPTPPGMQLETDSDWVCYYHAAGGIVANLSEIGLQDTVGAGNDQIIEVQNVIGSKFNDVITGNSQANILLGDAGNDILTGRADNDIFESNRIYVVSDALDGGAGSDIADYQFGDPTAIAIGPCPAPNTADTCANNDGEGGTDKLFNIETFPQPNANLMVSLLPGPNKRTIVAGQSVKLEFTVTGGDGNYKVLFDPTTAVVGNKEVAILAAPADQNAPVSPFTVGTDLEAYKAFRELTGTAVAGTWTFVVYARPLATTSFRVTVTDMATSSVGQDSPSPKQTSSLFEVVIADQMAVSIQQSEYTIKAGESVKLQGTVTGGTPPYTILWTLADGSAATGLSATNVLLPTANPTVTTSYKLTVTDTTPDSTNQVKTATTKVTVTPATPAVVPSGSSTPSGSSSGNSSIGGGGTNNGSAGTSTQTPTEASGKQESAPVVAAPMCGFGVTSWVMVGNLLALAVMKRRRW